MDVKVGDVVHVRGRVTHGIAPTQDDSRWLFTVGFDDLVSANVWDSEIVHVEPAPEVVIAIGDKVRGPMGSIGTVLGRDGGDVWIKWDDTEKRSVWSAKCLERVSP